MNRINIVLVRIAQLIVFLLFTFIVLTYFGTLILIPLDVVAQISALLAWIGLPGALAAVLSLPIVGYLGFLVYKIPRLLSTVLEIGFELAIIGQSRVCEFNDIVASMSTADYGSTTS
ncbi:MAG: hypothetical protein L0Y38_03685 [Methylococcaceae bacterium]|nr:hypothetical protein [Methylococcaceae bacterium]MCI0668227.1 hypothetical protein [Methylococcaceae bacterium]MCI0732910.1 hypothetical protein [Methylococcaceae bacterium]